MEWPGPLTHRQYMSWQRWQARQYNRPGRTDHYLMQVAGMIYALPWLVWGKKPPDPPEDAFVVPFKLKDGLAPTPPGEKDERKAGPSLKDQVTKIAQQQWLGRMTMPVQGWPVQEEVAGGGD